MATVDDAERMRLIQLGDLAINLYMKHQASFTEPKQDSPDPQTFILKIIAVDVQKLLIVSQCLGKRDGRKYHMAGEQIMAKNMIFDGVSEYDFRTAASENVDLWRHCQHEGRAAFEANIGAGSAATEEYRRNRDATGDPDNVRAIRVYDAWVEEELLQLPDSAGRRKVKAKCSFCGEKANNDTKLLACGRCKGVLYCDKICQKLHWKTGHKSACVEETSEVKGASGEGA